MVSEAAKILSRCCGRAEVEATEVRRRREDGFGAFAGDYFPEAKAGLSETGAEAEVRQETERAGGVLLVSMLFFRCQTEVGRFFKPCVNV